MLPPDVGEFAAEGPEQTYRQAPYAVLATSKPAEGFQGAKCLAELSDMITAKGRPFCQFLLEFWQDQPVHRSVPGQKTAVFSNGNMFSYHILTSPNSTLWT